MRTRSACLLALVAAAGCAAPIQYDYSAEPDPRKGEYVIGPSDGLRILVWKYADFTTEASVRPDGIITMPLLGDIRVAGATPSQVKKEVAQRLSAFVKDESAVVTVSVTNPNSYRFTVSGNVEHPGIFTSRNYVSVVEAVSMAGGLNKFAATHLTILRRGSKGETRRVPIEFTRIAGGEHQEENIVILPGDTLFVP